MRSKVVEEYSIKSIKNRLADAVTDCSEGGMDKKRELGASLVEYALLIALMCIIVIVAVRSTGVRVSKEFDLVHDELHAAGTSIVPN